ncbi:MAG TPA: hypothetical protein VIF85_06225 [Gaiellaceae bacterium]
MAMDRRIIPLRLKDADEFIRTWHRDHKHHNPDGYLEFAATVPERVAVGDAVHVRIDYVPASG